MSSNPPWMKAPQPAQGSGNLPPWMKNKAAETTTPPPASKPIQLPVQTPANNPIPPKPVQLPVQTPANNPPPASSTGGSIPPWMKNKEASQPPPPPTANKPFQPPASNNKPFQPPGQSNPPASQPWMKNKPATSPNPTDRQKQEEEQKKRKEEEQKQESIRKEKEAQRQAQQCKQMQREEQLSIAFEKQQQELEKQQRQKNKNKKTNKKGNKGKEPTSKSKKGSPSKQKAKKPEGNTHFHKFMQNLQLSCSPNIQYDEKLEHQKDMIKVMSGFSEQCREKLGEYMSQRKITARKKNCINLQNLFIDYGIIEGTNIEKMSSTGAKTTETIYKTKLIEDLEYSYCIYQVMFNSIVKLMKKTPIFRLRVPLLCWVSFKGVEFMCEGICEELTDAPSSNVQSYPEISGEIIQLERELSDNGYSYITRKNINIKKLTLNDEDIFVIYLAENFHTMMSHSHGSIRANPHKFYPFELLTLQKLTNFQLLFSDSLTIPYMEIKKIREIMKTSTDKMNRFLNVYLVGHAIRVVYGSCQGDIEEKYFWDLVFDGNEEIWGLIQQCYRTQFEMNFLYDVKNNFLLADILEILLPLKFTNKRPKTSSSSSPSQNSPSSTMTQSKKKKPVMSEHHPKIYLLPLQKFQTIQIMNLFSRNLQKSNKLCLAEESIRMQEQIKEISGARIVRDVDVFKNKVELLLRSWEINHNCRGEKYDEAHEDYCQALGMLERYQFQKNKDKLRFVVLPILLTVYMVNENPVLPKQEKEEGKEEKGDDKDDKDDNHEKKENKESDKKEEESSKIEEKKSSRKVHRIEQGTNQTKMLKTLAKLIEMFSEYLNSQEENWFHGGIYLLVAEYYSRKKVLINPLQLRTEAESMAKSQVNLYNNSLNASQIKKGSYFSSDSQRQSYQTLINTIPNEPHPHSEECMKFLEHAHSIFLQFYGTHSFELADMMVQKSVVLFNIGEFKKASAVIDEALKIYKSSSKHASIICQSQFILGKCLIEGGKETKDDNEIEEGRKMIEKIGNEFITLGMHSESISAFEYLYTYYQGKSRFIQRQSGSQNYSEIYLEKIAEISLHSHNSLPLKSVFKKVVQGEISIYSREKVSIFQKIYQQAKQSAEEEDESSEEVFLFLEEEAKSFGGFVLMTKWSLQVLEFKVDTYEWDRAAQIMKKTLTFFDPSEIEMIF